MINGGLCFENFKTYPNKFQEGDGVTLYETPKQSNVVR